MANVIVGCKLPNGIILELGNKKVTIKGANSSAIIGGHGITEGVDKELFDAWMIANKDLSFVKKGFIFAHEVNKNVSAEAKDRRLEKTGLEALDPKDMPKELTPIAA
jgi:hypothetical protein